jgi:hypothetical protein
MFLANMLGKTCERNEQPDRVARKLSNPSFTATYVVSCGYDEITLRKSFGTPLAFSFSHNWFHFLSMGHRMRRSKSDDPLV